MSDDYDDYDEYSEFELRAQAEKSDGLDIDAKDFLAIFIALLQTVMLPFVFMAVLMVLLALAFSIVFGANN